LLENYRAICELFSCLIVVKSLVLERVALGSIPSSLSSSGLLVSIPFFWCMSLNWLSFNVKR
jgi:hypothetical protein